MATVSERTLVFNFCVLALAWGPGQGGGHGWLCHSAQPQTQGLKIMPEFALNGSALVAGEPLRSQSLKLSHIRNR